RITGAPRMAQAEVVEKLDAGTVNIRSMHANVWNSVILPWIRQREVGQNYGYSIEGHDIRPADRGIGTFHRVEMSVPSLNGNTEAKGYETGAFIAKAEGEPRGLIADIRHNMQSR